MLCRTKPNWEMVSNVGTVSVSLGLERTRWFSNKTIFSIYSLCVSLCMLVSICLPASLSVSVCLSVCLSLAVTEHVTIGVFSRVVKDAKNNHSMKDSISAWLRQTPTLTTLPSRLHHLMFNVSLLSFHTVPTFTLVLNLVSRSQHFLTESSRAPRPI